VSVLRLQLARLIEVGRYREAKQLLGQAFAETPADPELHCLAARAALGEKDQARARDHVEQALAAGPGHFEARVLLFVLDYHQDRYPEAERTIIELIRERPDNAHLLALYAELMLNTLKLDKARALTAEALRRDPDDERAQLVNVLLLTIEGKRDDAGVQLAELIRADPEGAEIARTLFNVLLEQNRHREALEVGRQLLKLDPGNRALVESLAELAAATHWIAWPAYPLRRFGWAGAAGLWASGVFVLPLVVKLNVALGVALVVLYLLYIVYSWVYPPLLKRWLMRQGF
jgi:predicted Zn-dependent protease